MAEVRAVHECLFCPQTFDSAAAKDDHILQHFPQEICMDCNQNLIRIGSKLYTSHNVTTCIKRDLKTESNEETHLTNQPLLSHSNQYGPPDAICRETIYPIPTICTEAEIKPEPPEHVERSDTLEETNYLHQSSDFPTESHNDNLIVEPIMVSVELPVKSEFFDEREEFNQITDDGDDDYDNQSGLKHSHLHEIRKQSRDKTGEVNRKEKIVGEHAACDVCGKVMLAHSLYYHIRNVHRTTKEFKCEPCRKRFKTAEILRKHMRMKHDPSVKKFKCKLCCLVFMKEATLRAHLCKREMGEPPKTDPMPCDICGKMLGSKLSLRKHKILLHSPPGTIFCNVCGRLFCEIEDRDGHRIECARKQKNRSLKFFKTRSNNKEMTCDEPSSLVDDSHTISQTSDQSNSIEQHEDKKNRKRKFTEDHSECKICGKLLHASSIYSHMKNVHSATGLNSKPIRCDDCRKEFKNAENLRKHMRMKHDPTVKKFKCEHCCRVFVQENSLENHNCSRKMGKTVEKTNATIPCEICGKILSSKGALQRHQVLLHTSPETIFCNVCGRKFSNTEDRDVHREDCALKSHNRKSKAFSELGCFICNTKFMSNDALRHHIEMKHENCEKFECNLCHTVFMKKSSLRAHICKLKRENGIACEICEKVLATRRSLRVHKILVHSPPGLIFCNLCSRKCETIEEREGHMAECALKKKILSAKRRSRTFECDVCKAVFRAKSRIRHHMLQSHNTAATF